MRVCRFLIALLFPAALACATDISYTLTAGSDVITFSLPQQPSVITCNFATACFGVLPSNLVVDGTAVSNGQVNFYEPVDQGGLTVLQGSTLLMNNGGPGNIPLFSGTLTSPTLNTYSNLKLVPYSYGSPAYDETFLLNASTSAVAMPEPSAVVLLFIGFGSMLAVHRRRSTR